MSQARTLVDYALVRRRTLTSYAAGRLPAGDICDAQPYLLRAARYHGEATGEECPVCHRAELVRVNYTYGDCFRADANGRARATGELLGLAGELSEFTVFCVEVCQDCRWNHLLASYVLGTGERVGRRARS
ncbi:MAG: DUF5318 family protein [Frankiales bacterium]|nr:DUF5318 family protein [Frankiales bacterium]